MCAINAWHMSILVRLILCMLVTLITLLLCGLVHSIIIRCSNKEWRDIELS